jgi:prepilin-type N-terminal cleavage/methylation domain-containing protein
MSNRTRRGFTIIELLVVIGIIVVLLGILLPVVNAVRKQAQKADTSAEITKIAEAIHNYYQDYRSFPGPVPDANIYGFNTTVTTLASGTPSLTITNITELSSSQNLVLGLIGGLTNTGTVAAPAYSYPLTAASTPGGLVSLGPQSLNLLNPMQGKPYFDVAPTDLANNGAGAYVSWTTANVTITGLALSAVPEFMDHFSNQHPIIYLRARVGGTTICDASGSSQYYSKEMSPYWIGGSNVVPTVPTPGTPFPTQPDANNGNTQLWTSATTFFNNPAINDNVTPRSKDSFILISAGYDGVYGTSDDIIYSN